MIRVSNLGLAIDGKTILYDISARIPPQGLTAVIGPNGAGKSSLLYCLSGLTRPTSGQVSVDGTDITAARATDRARMLALLPQVTPALPRLTVADLVDFGRWPHHRGRPNDEDRRIVAQAIRDLDLDDLLDRRLDTLSGGQRQRAFIAMNHAQSTPWMLLDEPLSALDPRYASDIMARLVDLSRPGTGRAIVVVMHDLAMAVRHADWVICLKGGRLFRAGPPSETLTGDSLSALFDTRIHVEHLRGRPVVVID